MGDVTPSPVPARGTVVDVQACLRRPDGVGRTSGATAHHTGKRTLPEGEFGPVATQHF